MHKGERWVSDVPGGPLKPLGETWDRGSTEIHWFPFLLLAPSVKFGSEFFRMRIFCSDSKTAFNDLIFILKPEIIWLTICFKIFYWIRNGYEMDACKLFSVQLYKVVIANGILFIKVVRFVWREKKFSFFFRTTLWFIWTLHGFTLNDCLQISCYFIVNIFGFFFFCMNKRLLCR